LALALARDLREHRVTASTEDLADFGLAADRGGMSSSPLVIVPGTAAMPAKDADRCRNAAAALTRRSPRPRNTAGGR
jgi:hypothetical protein